MSIAGWATDPHPPIRRIPVVRECGSRRLKAAGGGAIPTKANVVVRYHGTGARVEPFCCWPTSTWSKPWQ